MWCKGLQIVIIFVLITDFKDYFCGFVGPIEEYINFIFLTDF